MLFNSLEYFLLFLPFVTLVYFACNRFTTMPVGKIWLIAASFFFYGYSSIKYVPLICLSILINFLLGKILLNVESSEAGKQESKKKTIVLSFGIITNLVFLGYFKYTNFFIETINLATHTSFPLLKIALPLAVSFYTFQQISYLVDCYKSKINRSNFIDYCLFVLFFPQLIAGPILRYSEIIPQLNQKCRRHLNWDTIATGIFVFSAGLFKKVVIADNFAAWSTINTGLDKPIGFIYSWIISLSYTFQLYYDFSGYSDMAIGAALLFNLRLPVNFNSPYKAVNIQDFWRRWHITLSHWLRDYIYIPLGGSRGGTTQTLINFFITFLLGGLWHGAGWTFVLWGALHGTALALHKIWQMVGFAMNAFWGRLCTFLFINFAWVYFNSPGITQANVIIKAMLGIKTDRSIMEEIALYQSAWNSMSITDINFLTITSVVIFASSTFIVPNTMQVINFVSYEGMFRFKIDHKFALLLSFIFTLSLMAFMGNVGQSDFIYFQF